MLIDNTDLPPLTPDTEHLRASQLEDLSVECVVIIPETRPVRRSLFDRITGLDDPDSKLSFRNQFRDERVVSHVLDGVAYLTPMMYAYYIAGRQEKIAAPQCP